MSAVAQIAQRFERDEQAEHGEETTRGTGLPHMTKFFPGQPLTKPRESGIFTATFNSRVVL